MHPIAIAIHGGAGTILKKNMSAQTEAQYRSKLTEALEAGYAVLEKGGSSADAVEAGIRVMEDSPLFNAGKGSVFTADGKNEMDASIMEGGTLAAGAVAQVCGIRNPISAARAVMEKSPHVMLVGEGAVKFAREQGLVIVDSSYFYDDTRWKQWQKVKDTSNLRMDHSDDGEKQGAIERQRLDIEFNARTGDRHGTVGAVALDRYGNLCAGTSTGGMTNKMYGRVGDSPIIGAGTFANNKTCAVSCTGHGEYFIRAAVAHDVSALIEYRGLPLKEAAEEVIHKKLPALGGTGGLIAIDSAGNIAMPFNTEGMYRGYRKEGGKAEVFIYKED